MNRFYLISTTGGLTTFAVSPDLFEIAVRNDLHGPESGRDIHHQLLYGDDNGGYPLYIEFPVVYRQSEGKRLCDMLDMRFDGQCFLISDRMKQLLEDNGITGWKSYPVLLFDKKGNEVNGYNGFTVSGRGGSMDIVPNNHWAEGQWDGSDFFRILPNYLVITERTKLLLKKNRITSAGFRPLSDLATIIPR